MIEKSPEENTSKTEYIDVENSIKNMLKILDSVSRDEFDDKTEKTAINQKTSTLFNNVNDRILSYLSTKIVQNGEDIIPTLFNKIITELLLCEYHILVLHSIYLEDIIAIFENSITLLKIQDLETYSSIPNLPVFSEDSFDFISKKLAQDEMIIEWINIDPLKNYLSKIPNTPQNQKLQFSVQTLILQCNRIRNYKMRIKLLKE